MLISIAMETVFGDILKTFRRFYPMRHTTNSYTFRHKSGAESQFHTACRNLGGHKLHEERDERTYRIEYRIGEERFALTGNDRQFTIIKLDSGTTLETLSL